MNPRRTCYCVPQAERDLCALRDKLSGGHQCQSLAPWERELYGERLPEPHVDLVATFTDGTVETFNRVRGIKHSDGLLTFEDDESLFFYVPNVKFWTTALSD